MPKSVPGSTHERRQMTREGAYSTLSLAVAMAPWGIVAGAAMVSAGLTPVQAVAMSVFVYAGSIQIAVLPLLIAKAPLWVMLATALAMNLRYVIYSASLASHFDHLPLRWRVFLSYITSDAMFAIFVARHGGPQAHPQKHWFFLGGSLLQWLSWQLCTAIGVFGGALIPPSWSLEFAATLSLIALLVPLLVDRAMILCAFVAGVAALALIGMPLKLGVIVAITAGVAVGAAVSAFFPAKAGGP